MGSACRHSAAYLGGRVVKALVSAAKAGGNTGQRERTSHRTKVATQGKRSVNAHEGGGYQMRRQRLSHEGSRAHKAKAVSQPRRRWSTQGEGSVSATQAVEHTRQDQCFCCEGSENLWHGSVLQPGLLCLLVVLAVEHAVELRRPLVQITNGLSKTPMCTPTPSWLRRCLRLVFPLPFVGQDALGLSKPQMGWARVRFMRRRLWAGSDGTTDT